MMQFKAGVLYSAYGNVESDCPSRRRIERRIKWNVWTVSNSVGSDTNSENNYFYLNIVKYLLKL